MNLFRAGSDIECLLGGGKPPLGRDFHGSAAFECEHRVRNFRNSLHRITTPAPDGSRAIAFFNVFPDLDHGPDLEKRGSLNSKGWLRPPPDGYLKV